LASFRILPLVCVIAGCQPTVVSEPIVAQATNSSGPSAFASQTDYRVAPQDTVEISVFQVPSLNRAVQVDGNGRLSLPLIGSVVAGGRTTRELEADIAAKLGARYVQSPQVAVSVKDGLGQRVTVDGAVKKPGVYTAKGETSLLQTLAQAGGLDEVADGDSINVFRVTNQQRTATQYSLSAIRAGRAVDPQIFGGDTIIVGESAAKNAWRMVKDIAPIGGVARALVP